MSQNNANKELQESVLDIDVEQLTKLKKLGYVRSEFPKIAAFNVLGVLNKGLRWYREDGKLPAKKAHHEMIAFILRALEIPE